MKARTLSGATVNFGRGRLKKNCHQLTLLELGEAGLDGETIGGGEDPVV
jgi:hypothetical protein